MDECVPDLETTFHKFVEKAVDYMKKSKDEQKHLIKDKVMQQILSSVHTIKKSNIFLTSDFINAIQSDV